MNGYKLYSQLGTFLLLSVLVFHTGKAHDQVTWYGLQDAGDTLSINNFLVDSLPDPKTQGEILNFGITTKPSWIYGRISTKHDLHVILDNPLLSKINYYVISKGKIIREMQTGSYFPVSSRAQDFPGFLFTLPPQGEFLVVFKVTSDYPLVVPIELIPEDELHTYLVKHQRISTLVLGLLFALTLFYIMVSIALNEKTYYYYSIYAFAITLNIARANGQLAHWILPFYPSIAKYSTIIDILPAIAVGLFFLHFIRVKRYHPLVYRIVMIMIWTQVISILIVLIGYNHLALNLTYLVASLFMPLALVTTFLIYRNHYYVPAIYYFIASIFLFTGSVILILQNNGIVIHNSVSALDLFQICVAIEMLILAMGVSKRIESLKNENLNIQKENIRIINQQKDKLKKLVNEQTEEINDQNDELKETIEKLRITQSQLIESEKSAILGLLTAGLSHEINNPLNYIKGGSESIKKNLKEMMALEYELNKILGEIESLKDESIDTDQLVKLLAKYRQKKKDGNYQELAEETRSLLNNVNTGADKISEIIYFLKTISGNDEEDYSSTDLEKKIDATLSLLKYKFKDFIEVTREFGGVPKIWCNPRKIGQVLMSLILNAIEAISGKGHITIKTWHEDKKVKFSIEDSGHGIPEEELTKIFDPFYSTKDPAGSGLGLSIVRAIIQDHNGNIEVESEPGKTIIYVELPIEQNTSSKPKDQVYQYRI